LQKNNIANNFDILRLVLAILVFFAHWNILTAQDMSSALFHLSGYAVDMFFIVSGFLIFWSFDADQNKKHFYIKRFFRVFPLYAILILLQTLFYILFSDGTLLQIGKYFVSNIFFLNFLSPSVGTTLSSLHVDAINGSLWTLKNEVIFYLLVPFIFAFYKKFGVLFLAVLYSLSVVYMLGVEYFGMTKLLVLFPSQLRLFLVGIIFYIIFERINKKNIYPIVFLSLVLILLFSQNSYFKFIVYPFLIGTVMIFLTYFFKKIKINFDFSYSFYILHFPVIQLSLYFGLNASNPFISFISLFVIVLVLSYFSEKYIEKRFIRLGKNIIKRDFACKALSHR
jgi:peptidoglycan/LPS O-acetylase OafA/YrhL